MNTISIKTAKKKEVVDITETINKTISGTTGDASLCNIHVLHTTAAIMIADLDPGGTDKDYLDAFEEMVPKLSYRHPHNPKHMPDHILSSVIGTSLLLPMEDTALVLGTWQRVVLIELDGPRTRSIIVTTI